MELDRKWGVSQPCRDQVGSMLANKTLLLSRELDEFLTVVDGSPAVFVNACSDRYMMLPEAEFRRLKILAGESIPDEIREPEPIVVAEPQRAPLGCATSDFQAHAC